MRTLQSELVKKGFSKMAVKKQKPPKKKRKKVERFSRFEIEELMGVRRDVFVRGKGGAVKRR